MKRHDKTIESGGAGWIASSAIWWLTAAFLAFTVLYPSAVLIINSFRADGKFSLSNYIRVFSDSGILTSMGNSMKVAVPSTLIATVIGVFLAWAVVRTDIPAKRLWQKLLAIPYFIPPFIGAIAWTFLLGPTGYLNTALMKLFHLSSAPFNVYSIGGMIFVMSLYRYAVPFMVVLPTMKKISASLEEAARSCGASRWRTLRDITIPLITPSIIGAMLLLFMFVLADFGVSAVLGAPDRIRLMTTQIYYLINRPDLPNNLQIASAYSIVLAAFGLLGLGLYARVLRTNRFVVISGKSASAQPMRLGRHSRRILSAVLLLFFLCTTCAPVLAALVTSLTRTYGLPFGRGNITLANFLGLASVRNISRAFRNSAFLSVASAVIITLVTLVVAYVAIRGGARGIRGMGLMQVMVTLPYAVPGTIIALSMILAFAKPLPLTGVKLYGTIWILLIAYLARFMNLGYNNISGAISQIDRTLEDAARASGASPQRAFTDIMMPLLRGSLIGSFLLVFAPTLSEVTLSSLLWSVGNETIGTIVFSSQEEGAILRTAALAILLILIVVAVNMILQSAAERSERGARRKKEADKVGAA